MGLLSDAIGIIANPFGSQADVAGDALGVSNPRTTSIVTGISTLFGPEAGALASSFAPSFIDSPDGPVQVPSGGDIAVGGGGGPLAALSGVAAAIVALAMKLGGRVNVNSASSIASYGAKVWNSLASWAAKNPSVNLVSTLVALGLTVEQAAQFVAWGTTRKRRRRGRGINNRDLRTTRRTIRKVMSIHHQLAGLVGRTSSRRFVSGARTSIIKA